MSDITVRRLGEDDWQEYKAVRLAALRESPEAFAATAGDEEAFDDDLWRDRMTRSERLVAEREDEAVGVLSIGSAKTTPTNPDADDDAADAAPSDGSDESAEVAEIFGLWVRPSSRGSGVATRLVKEAAQHARDSGRSHVVYWVGTENGRAVAFASGMGFLPTDYRRPMGVVSEEDGEEEIAMVLPLGQDVGPHPRF
ncbi:GNAT family N-acetyltransferase [Terracoccus luteus]|jgi:ribosomal protein S18 acetylase RimI-like enzyme|uniref:Ribosomal protein S18 acetylase RimI-like enzyme n=1 Tax=Terracoccus luteus TaxID=53356 RepID=A0A839PW13_9MICO|nr:GNAT family N-acetyltransferase [Terracoccus luteus]MBB2986176.1 ribosomal protein S18 acetylase RimI-like enzyme [Terracoccus luteus]MCP2172234.1 ribosomal protein S18 acetylase RimI-like enzyme [Terracoccus luteus]